MKQEMHALFHGRVQGVFFRATAKEIAQELGLVGTVKNLPDGSVELIAQGEEKELEQLVRELEQRFHLDSSQPVQMTYRPPQQEYTSFSISWS